jgi:hypothetical protein
VCGRPPPPPSLRVAGPINEDTANPLGQWPWMASYGRDVPNDDDDDAGTGDVTFFPANTKYL